MTMKGEIVTVVRLSISEIAEVVAEQNDITVPLANYKLERDSLILSFTRSSKEAVGPREGDSMIVSEVDRTKSTGPGKVNSHQRPDRRSSRRKRRRMKTRGWKVVGMIKNSYGQSARIYRPFVDALSQKGLTTAQKRSIVAKILRGNGNRPTDSSIEYYMMNTIEFLSQAPKEESLRNGG